MDKQPPASMLHAVVAAGPAARPDPVARLAEIWATEMVKVMGFPSIPGETGPPGEQLVRGCVRLARTFFAELAEPTPWPDKPLPREDPED